METNTKPLPKIVTRPILLFYESSFGESARILYPEGTNEFLHFNLTGDMGFGYSITDNDFILQKIKQAQILHWEYL